MRARVSPLGGAIRLRLIAIDGIAARLIIWLAVAAFLLGFGYWATRSGLRLRDETWVYTRTLRFHGDVKNALFWGNRVIEAAKEEAPDSSGHAAGPPTFWQIVRGESRVYDTLVNGTDGDYGLDYPPLRLLTMSLWTRHVQAQYPGLSDWPGPWQQGEKINEGLAEPLLQLNTLFTWLSCIFAFFLVWIWVDRGGRRGTLPRVSRFGPRRPAWRRPTPLIHSVGLLLFPPLACVFFYAMLVATTAAPAPPPVVTFSGPPVVSRVADSVSATIRATINSQGAQTGWSVEWGTTPGDYTHSLRGDGIGDSGLPVEVSLTLPELPIDSVVHYRITARNDGPDRDLGRGMTRTDDGLILTGPNIQQQPQPPEGAYGDVWLSIWQWLGIAALLAALGGAMRLMPAEHRGWACGLLAAMLMWLNPCVLVDSHIWPQWDIWLLPPFLLSALLASVDWWFCAGLVFGIGTMFKGQFLIGAPILILWPLFSMRAGATVRLLCGIVISTAVVVSPWLILGDQAFSSSLPAIRWILRIGLAAVLGAILPFARPALGRAMQSLWKPREEVSLLRLGLLSSAIAAALLVMIALVLDGWPADSPLPRSAGMLLFIALLLLPWILLRRWLGVFITSFIGIAIWMSAWLYHGDWSWELVGFEYGANKFDHLAPGRGSAGNLTAILQQRFGWELHDPAVSIRLPNLAGFLHAHWPGALGFDGNSLTLDLRQTLIAGFAASLVACGIGAALNDRRNHPHFLAALVAPWMLIPNVLAQMHLRYEVWGAALSAMLVGISPAYTLVNVFFSLLGAGMILNSMLDRAPDRSPQLHQLLTTLSPDHGWIMLCLAALVLVVAVTPGEIDEDLPPLAR